MGDVLKIRDEYRQVQWAAAIQKCKASRPSKLVPFMPWAPDIQVNCKLPNADAYVNTYLE